jgi:hypothetical protein
MRQQLTPGRPSRRVLPRLSRNRDTQKPHHQDGQVQLLVGLSAQNRGEQPMQLHSGRLDPRQPVLTHQPGQRGERQRIRRRGRQGLG